MILQPVIKDSVTEITAKNEQEMLVLGARIGAALRAGDTIALIGDLGAGKTTLVRGLIQAQFPGIDVPSPTYTLVQTYDFPEYELWHCDLYRLKHPDEVFEIGLMDAFGDAVCLLEWPDKIGAYLPEDALSMHIRFKEEGRIVEFGSEWKGRNV